MIVGRAHFIPSNELESTIVAIIHGPGQKTGPNNGGRHFQHVSEVQSTWTEVIRWRLQTRFGCNVNG